jgi:hypothetical protein
MKLDKQTDPTIRELYIVEVSIASVAVLTLLAGAVFGLCFGLYLSYNAMSATVYQVGATRLTVPAALKSLLTYGTVSAIVCATIVCILGTIIARFFNAIASATGGLRVKVRDA